MSPTNHLVSIILPCYNVQDYLDNALTSVLNQTYTNWECIIINDGSSDNTANISQQWQQKDKRFKYIFQDNKGLSSARNSGLKHANGDFIYFFDPDDLISEITIENLMNLVSADVDIVIGKNAVTEGQNYNEKRYLKHFTPTRTVIENKDKYLLKIAIEEDIICVAWNKLYRKSFLDAHNLKFKKGILHEDELWFFETLLPAKAIIFNDKATYFYNVDNSNSITSTFKEKNLTSYLTILKTIYSNYVLKTPDGITKQMICNYVIHLKIKTINHCYKQLSKKVKKQTNNSIKETFSSVKATDANPKLLSESFEKLFTNFSKVEILEPKGMLNFLRYYGSKKLSRRIKSYLIMKYVNLKK